MLVVGAIASFVRGGDGALMWNAPASCHATAGIAISINARCTAIQCANGTIVDVSDHGRRKHRVVALRFVSLRYR